MDGEAKCNCQRCGQPIAFPLNLHNTEADCPHCGKTTTLVVPQIRALPRQEYSAAPSVQTSANSENNGLVVAGYVAAILMPLVGFIIGIILLAKNKVGSGIGCIIVSVICGIIWLALLNS
jgi:hypothetical protein